MVRAETVSKPQSGSMATASLYTARAIQPSRVAEQTHQINGFCGDDLVTISSAKSLPPAV